jgi:WS/DGAT/MGAT family acyltransferase
MVSIARLTAIDSSFLRVESETAHMHVGWIAMLEPAPGRERLDVDDLRDVIAGRLHNAPRFRQKVTPAPLGAEPVWEDDPRFRLADHVRELPVTFAGMGLRRLTDEFFSRPLRRDRPLWEIVLVPQVAGGRAVLLGKIHHAMVDGVGAVELGMLLFDLEPDAEPLLPVPWRAEPSAGPVRLALDALVDTVRMPIDIATKALALTRSPSRVLGALDALRRTATSVAGDLRAPAPDSYLNPEIGPRRTLVTHRVDLDRLLQAKDRAGVKLNDVVLAVCAGALRRFALDRGEQPIDLRVMVPVNVRRPGEEGAAGNRITFGFIELPISAELPEERVRRVAANMNALKQDGRIEGGSMLLDGLGLLPEPIRDAAVRLAASPRLYNLVISNVPGPKLTLYAAGARVTAIHPVIPTPDCHALSIGVLTYEGAANFTCYADPDALPDVDRLAFALEEALIEIERALAGRPAPPERPAREHAIHNGHATRVRPRPHQSRDPALR